MAENICVNVYFSPRGKASALLLLLSFGETQRRLVVLSLFRHLQSGLSYCSYVLPTLVKRSARLVGSAIPQLSRADTNQPEEPTAPPAVA